MCVVCVGGWKENPKKPKGVSPLKETEGFKSHQPKVKEECAVIEKREKKK